MDVLLPISRRFLLGVAMLITTGIANPATSQTLTRISSTVTGEIVARASIPAPCDCDYYTEPCNPTTVDTDLFEVKDLVLSMADQQSLDTDSCGDTAMTNLSLEADASVPGNVHSSTLLMAEASGYGYVSGIDERDLVVRAEAIKRYRADATLKEGEVLIFYGTVDIDKTDEDYVTAAGALGEGPGVDLEVDFQLPGVQGTVVDVLNGTTTHYDLKSREGLTASFSAEVSPGGEIAFRSRTSSRMHVTLTQDETNSTATAMVGGTLGIFNKSSLPQMTTHFVTDGY